VTERVVGIFFEDLIKLIAKLFDKSEWSGYVTILEIFSFNPSRENAHGEETNL